MAVAFDPEAQHFNLVLMDVAFLILKNKISKVCANGRRIFYPEA
jgi:hypothetical protein